MPPKLRQFVIAFAAAAGVFLLLDAVWLSTMAPRLYRPALGHLMREDFGVLAAATFYVIYLTGMVVFVILSGANARTVVWRGAFFGFVCYATYDLTNQATLLDWPWHVTVIDLAWGSFVTAISAWVSFRFALRRRG